MGLNLESNLESNLQFQKLSIRILKSESYRIELSTYRNNQIMI